MYPGQILDAAHVTVEINTSSNNSVRVGHDRAREAQPDPEPLAQAMNGRGTIRRMLADLDHFSPPSNRVAALWPRHSIATTYQRLRDASMI